MTLVADPPVQAPAATATPSPAPAQAPARRRPAPFTPARIAVTVLAWLGVTVAAVVVVLYGVGPLLEQRDQSSLLNEYRTEVRQAASQTEGLAGVQAPTEAPGAGDPVGILEINEMQLRQVVVENVGPDQTRQGPGHAPGTAGVGQPGNSVVVGRRSMFGGPFHDLAGLRRGDRIVATTTQGRSLYVVRQVRQVEVTSPDPDAAGPVEAAAEGSGTTRPRVLRAKMTTEALYGPTPTDQLTLITSASAAPWATGTAQVVVASMRGKPFEATLQGGRTDGADGRHGASGAWPALILALLAYGAAAVTATWLYRNARLRSAWLLTAPVLVALAFVLAESIARVLPAWA
jgi:sortase A